MQKNINFYNRFTISIGNLLIIYWLSLAKFEIILLSVDAHKRILELFWSSTNLDGAFFCCNFVLLATKISVSFFFFASSQHRNFTSKKFVCSSTIRNTIPTYHQNAHCYIRTSSHLGFEHDSELLSLVNSGHKKMLL